MYWLINKNSEPTLFGERGMTAGKQTHLDHTLHFARHHMRRESWKEKYKMVLAGGSAVTKKKRPPKCKTTKLVEENKRRSWHPG